MALPDSTLYDYRDGSGYYQKSDQSGPYAWDGAAMQLASGTVSLTAAQVAALKAAGTPVAPGTVIIDSASPYSVLGVVDGSGNLAGRRQLLSTGIRFVLPSSGSVGANGALTLTTALVAAFAQSFMYFPAGAVFSGSAAGRYYVVMSTTTAGTIYTNTYTSGVPAYPTSPTAVVDAGPGAYTQTTGARITLINVTIPAGTIGPNGRLELERMGSMAGSGNKAIDTLLGGNGLEAYTATTQTSYRVKGTIQNGASEAVNVGNSFNHIGLTTSGTLTRTTVNTSVDQSLTLNINMATATDYFTMESVLIETIYAA